MRNKGALFVCLDKVEGNENSLNFFYGCSVAFQLFFSWRGGSVLGKHIYGCVPCDSILCLAEKNSRESDNDVTWSQSNFVTIKSTPCSSLR